MVKIDQLEEIAMHVKKERLANETLRRQKKQEHLKLFTEGRKMEECESFVLTNDLSDNPQVHSVMDAAR